MTCLKNLDTKATAVKKTWARHFNEYIFISSVANASFPVIGLNVSEGRDHLTAKTMQAYRYVHQHFLHKADWFMKADDDTFVIAENLRFFLSHYSPEDPVFFGLRFKWGNVSQGYMSGGARYVLSRAALKLLASKGQDPKICRQDGGYEDVEIGKCLFKLGVKAGESLDNKGRETFHEFKPILHLEGQFPRWFSTYTVHKIGKGYACCSDYTISFHYMSPSDIYLLDFMLYHLRPIGRNSELPEQRIFNRNDTDHLKT